MKTLSMAHGGDYVVEVVEAFAGGVRITYRHTRKWTRGELLLAADTVAAIAAATTTRTESARRDDVQDG